MPLRIFPFMLINCKIKKSLYLLFLPLIMVNIIVFFFFVLLVVVVVISPHAFIMVPMLFGRIKYKENTGSI